MPCPQATTPYDAGVIRAVLFDFGGVVTTSPFEAFATYEADNGLPKDLIRTINSTNPDDNAWAKYERSDVDADGFGELFEAEARALGHEVDAKAVLACLSGDVRPEMAEAVRRCSERLTTACLTNNIAASTPDDAASSDGGHGTGLVSSDPERQARLDAVKAHFTVIVESSKVGLRKPDPAFYRLACDMVGIEPTEAVFLDDLGINLKPARAMGMTTIKVLDARRAIAELSEVVGFELG